MAPLWNSDPESLLATPGNYASKGQQEMARAMMASLQKDNANKTPMINRWQGVAHVINSLAEAGWGNVAANLANKSGRDFGTASGNYYGGGDQQAAPGQGENTGSPGGPAPTSRSPMPSGSADQANLGSDASSPDYFREQAKRSENGPLYDGRQATSKAAWDYKLHTNGFGTRATSPGEVIDAATAHQRFNDEWAKSNAQVKARYPGIDYGSEQAMTSLNHNGGEGVYLGKGLDKAMLAYSQTGDPKALEEAKQRFLQYNRAGGNYIQGLQNRRNREVNWFGQQAPQQVAGGDAQHPNSPPMAGQTVNNPTAPIASTVPGISTGNEPAPAGDEAKPLGYHRSVKSIDIPSTRMNLGAGGERAQDVAREQAELQQVAQNTGGQASSTNPSQSPIQKMPGYTGQMPDTGYVPKRENMQRLMMSPKVTDEPELGKKIGDDYKSRTEPYVIKGNGGMFQVTPRPDGNSEVKFLPIGEGAPISMGAGGANVHTMMYPHMDTEGNVTQQPNIPGAQMGTGSPTSGGQSLGGAADLMKGLQKIDREGKINEDIGKERAGSGSDLAKQGLAATNSIRNLNEMKGIVDLLNTDTGPTADTAIKVKEFMKNFAPEQAEKLGINNPDLAGGELMQKLNTYFASEATKSFNSRGTNFDLQTFMRSFPGNLQSKEGTKALINMLMQEFEAKKEIGLKAGALTAEDYSRDPNILSHIATDHYKENPIKMTLGDKVYHAQAYANPDEMLKHVKVGEYYPRKDDNGQTIVVQRKR